MKYSTLRRQHNGASIVEALIAMAIMLGGMAAILNLYGNVISNSTQNRLTSAAVTAANAKLEELRVLPFDQLESDADTYVFLGPSLSGSSQDRLTRCWSIAPVSHVGTNLLRADVAVVLDHQTCAPGSDALAHLTTLISRVDPRDAASDVLPPRSHDGHAARGDEHHPYED